MTVKGTTEECLKDYLKKLPWGTRLCDEARQPLADFCGLGTDAVRRWIVGDIFPRGEILTKVQYFLEAEGYEVEELRILPQPVYDLGRLIACGKLDMEETREKIGFATLSSFYQFLHGKRGTSKARMSKIHSILSQNSTTNCLPKDRTVKIPPIENKESMKREAEYAPARENPEARKKLLSLLRVFDELIHLTAPLLEEVLSDEVSGEERRMLREEGGKYFVFNLSNDMHTLYKMLNALCGERAREIVKNGTDNIISSGKKRR